MFARRSLPFFLGRTVVLVLKANAIMQQTVSSFIRQSNRLWEALNQPPRVGSYS